MVYLSFHLWEPCAYLGFGVSDVFCNHRHHHLFHLSLTSFCHQLVPPRAKVFSPTGLPNHHNHTSFVGVCVTFTFKERRRAYYEIGLIESI